MRERSQLVVLCRANYTFRCELITKDRTPSSTPGYRLLRPKWEALGFIWLVVFNLSSFDLYL